MKLKAFNILLLLLLSGAYITNAQNKVYGTVQVNDEGFSTNDVFIYDGNNKFLTTPDEKGYYEFFTEKKKMNMIGKELTRDLQEKKSQWAWTCSKCGYIVKRSTRKFRSNYFHKECLGKLKNIPIIRPTSSEH